MQKWIAECSCHLKKNCETLKRFLYITSSGRNTRCFNKVYEKFNCVSNGVKIILHYIKKNWSYFGKICVIWNFWFMLKSLNFQIKKIIIKLFVHTLKCNKSFNITKFTTKIKLIYPKEMAKDIRRSPPRGTVDKKN